MNTRTIRPNRCAAGAIAALSLAAILIGCGGSGGLGGSQSGVAVSMDWSGSRVIGQAQSVTFSLTNTGTSMAVQQILNEAPSQAQQSAVFKGLPAGNYILVAKSFDQTNGHGNEVSQVATSLEVTQGNMSTVALAMAGQIKDIVIPSPPTSPVAGSTVQMTGAAEDSMGRLLMLPPDALQWSVNANGFGATIQPNGVLVTSAAGTITVTLADVGTSHRATVTLNISNPSSTGGATGTTTGSTGTTTGTSGTSTTGTTTATTTGTTTSTTTTGTTTGSTTGTTGETGVTSGTTAGTTTGTTAGSTTGTTGETGATTGTTGETGTTSTTNGVTTGTTGSTGFTTTATTGVSAGTTGG